MIEFDEKKHVYKKDGTIYPGVTEILTAEGLIDIRWFTSEARKLGTEIHEITTYLDKQDIETDTFDDKYQGYIEAYKKFLRESDFIVHKAEVQIISEKYSFAGTVDRKGLFIDIPALLDIKTGQPLHWHPLQLAGYQILSQEYNAELFSLYLREDGTYKLIKHKDDFRHRADFFAALRMYYYKVEKGIIK